ncbi:transposase [Streptomyces sp. NPDC050982]|uniref:transposase n=1 Tax=Streptomyces sp. NPDC050982 TaxID=3154746 RepID=UPI0034116DBA
MAPAGAPGSSYRTAARQRPLLPIQEADNTEHRKVRARVEHTFAWMKNYKILRDCRQRGDGLHHAVARIYNLAMTA